MSIVYRLSICIIFIFTSVCISNAQQPITYSNDGELIDIVQKIQYIEDTTSKFISNPDAILTGDVFATYDQDVLNFANTQSAFWFKFTISNQIQDKVYLQVKNPMLDSLVLFEVSNNNHLQQLDKAGATFPFATRNIQYTLPNFLLPLDSTQSKTFILYIKSNFPTQTVLSVGSTKAIFESNHKFDVAIGIYIGIMFVMGLYNLFIFFTIKNRLYLYYVGYVFFIGLIYVMFKGYAFEFIWFSNPKVNFYVPVVSSIAISFVQIFARNFLETRINSPRLDKGFYVLLSLCAISVILGLFGNYQLSAITGQLAVILMAFFLIAVSFSVLLSGYRPARFFIVAWFAYLIGLIIFILQLNAAIPHTWFTNNSVLFGSAIEVVLLSFALADRINIYKKQKEEAQKQALVKTQENERLIKEQNEILKIKVSEATEDLRMANEELNSTNEELHATIETVQQQKDTIEERSTEIESINEELKTINEELNSTNEELHATVETVRQQNQIIAEKNLHITDSLRYAQTIQDAILPFEERMDKHLKEYFAFYRPKDIVSGDFYWLTDLKGKIYLAVADCTGHGVPGAFMSMIGSAALDALVDRNELEDPAEILHELHLTIQKALKQENSTNDDGMDIGLCVLEYLEDGTCKVLFSGAKRPLYYYKHTEGKIHEIRGTRQSIGGYSKKTRVPFDVETLILEKGDCFYLSSDGYADQNNKNDLKFGTPNLKKLMESMATKPMKEQGVLLQQSFEEHKGNEVQRDDVAVIGVKIS